MNKLLDWVGALTEAGVEVRTLPGWDTHARDGYDWREQDGNPAGMMHHHTASASYAPNREKANAYAGVGYDHTPRLYQENYGDGRPVFVVANAYPAPVSSGYGVRAVLDQFVKANIPFTGKQTRPDDDWAGNTHYINIEWVLDGVGARIDEGVWEMMVKVCIVTNDLMSGGGKLWTPARHIAHAHHTRRKIDLRDGRFPDADTTIQQLRAEIHMDPNCPWSTGSDYPACDRHYTPDTDMPLGNGEGEHQGMCNVPTQQKPAVDWGFKVRRLRAGNAARYDYAELLTVGRELAFEYRDAGSPT